MRVQKPATIRGWAKWIAWSALVLIVVRVAYPILDLNVQTWAQANGVDKMWSWRWHATDPFAAGLGWWVCGGALLIGLIAGMAIDGWSRRITARLAPRPAPVAAVPKAAPVLPIQPIKPPAVPEIRGTSPAYRTAVLQIEKLRPEMEANSNSVITKSSCTIDIKNVTQQPLDGCTVVLASITGNGKVTEIGEALRPGEFSAPRSLTHGILLVRRDRTDIVSNPPHLIRTVDRDIPLEEGISYVLQFELRSPYPYPTLAAVQIDVPEDPDMAVVPTILSQDVSRT